MAEKISEVEGGLPQPVVCGVITFDIYNKGQCMVDREEEVTELDLLSSLLTGPEAKEIVLYKEDNFTFDIALATARDNSWDGLHNGGFHNFEEKKLKSIDSCSQMGQQRGLSKIEIMNRMADMLKTPSPPSEAKRGGKVVWYQYPWTEKGPTVKEAMDNVKDWQEKGDYLLLGIVYKTSPFPFSQPMIDEHFIDSIDYKYPNYSFLGVDRKFVNELVSYGYSYQGSISSDKQNQSNADNHLTLIFQKK